MSLILRFASIKCPIRTIFCVKRFYWTSHSFSIREGLGIRYFIPRTAGTRDDIQTERMKHWDSIPGEFKVIYSFSHDYMFEMLSYSALVFGIIFICAMYDPKFLMKLAGHKKEEENEPISEEPVLEDNSTPNEIIEEVKPLKDSFFINELFHSGDPRAKSLIGLAMITAFFYVRSRCVLKIYRQDIDYVTVFYQAFGFGKKVIKHKASDCSYYPKRKYFNHNLNGKNVIIFRDLFVSHEERQLFIGRKSL